MDTWLEEFRRQYPLHGAVAADDSSESERLLAAGAEVDAHDDFGWTPLMWATSGRTVKALLEAGADPGVATEDGETVLMALARRADAGAVEALVDVGVDPNEVDAGGNVALGEAASAGNVATMGVLLARGANVDASTGSGETPLWAAVREGNLAAVELLVRSGATVSQRVSLGAWSGRTVLDVAVASGRDDIATILRSVG